MVVKTKSLLPLSLFYLAVLLNNSSYLKIIKLHKNPHRKIQNFFNILGLSQRCTIRHNELFEHATNFRSNHKNSLVGVKI